MTATLASNGGLSFFNFAGTVHLAVDVSGYYTSGDDRYYTKDETRLRVGAGPQTIGITPSFVYTGPFAASATIVAATFTTTRASELHITWTTTGGVVCPSDLTSYSWIQLDRTNVPDSFQATPNTNDFHNFTEDLVTPSLVPAGNHTLTRKAGCTSGSISTTNTAGASTGSVQYVTTADVSAP